MHVRVHSEAFFEFAMTILWLA